MTALLIHLGELVHADVDLPVEFDGLVRESVAEVADREWATAA